MAGSVLITFLGRVPRGESGYRTTRYDFGGGDLTAPVAFLGWSLAERVRPDRLVVLGTTGSMWDHLCEGDIVLGDAHEDARLALVDAVARKSVTSQHLADVVPLLRDALGMKVELGLIPYCRSESEQIELLRIMAGHVRSNDAVQIDVTHGLRHHPLIALIAALYLRVVKDARIEKIWYGAFDPDTNDAPVYDLSGLLRIADWLQALHTYDKDGDYGVFASMLGTHGIPLAEAAFFERTTNPVRARQVLSGWSSRKDRFPEDDPAIDLFSQELLRRVGWFKAPDRSNGESQLAAEYLKRGDYLRAAVYGQEGMISSGLPSTDVNRFERREEQRLLLKNDWRFRQLERLRNSMAHGVRSTDEQTRKALSSDANLRRALGSLFDDLFARSRQGSG